MAVTKKRKVADSRQHTDCDDDSNNNMNAEHDETFNNTDPDNNPPSQDDPEQIEGEEEDEQGREVLGDEDISSLLESLSRDHLLTLLRSAAADNPRLRSEIRRLADLDPSQRKIFVHGLNWSTSADALRSFFSQYGDIDECRVVTDRSSGKSKGYGFVLFRLRYSARAALSSPQKLIDGRMTACQLASVGPTAPGQPPSHQHQPHQDQHQNRPHSDTLPRKIYVGNVHADIDGGRLLDFFSRFGEIEEGPLGFDRQTGKPKGFALFIYRTVEGARKALEEPNKNFEGHLLYCQKATDSQKSKAAGASSGTPSMSSGQSMQGGGAGYAIQGPPGYSVPAGNAGYNGAMEMGIIGTPMAFGQGMPANAAALAMLAAAGQNPAAYGVPPAFLASLNPALAAAMGGSAQAMAMQAAVPTQGYGLASTGYQNAGYQAPAQTVNQGGVTYQAVPIGQTPPNRSTMGPMGGYGQH